MPQIGGLARFARPRVCSYCGAFLPEDLHIPGCAYDMHRGQWNLLRQAAQPVMPERRPVAPRWHGLTPEAQRRYVARRRAQRAA